MRIALVASNQQVVGGAEAYQRWLLPALQRRGHEVAFAFEHPARDKDRRVDAAAGPIERWSLQGVEPGRFARLLGEWRPDVVYSQGLVSGEMESTLCSEFAVVGFAHDYRGTCLTGNKRYGRLRPQPCTRKFGAACLAMNAAYDCGVRRPLAALRLYGVQQRRLDAVLKVRRLLVASRHMQDEYVRHGFAPGRVDIIPLPTLELQPDAEPPLERPPTGELLFVGRLTRLKGCRQLLRALPLAERLLKRSLRLTIAGDGPDEGPCRRLAARLGVKVRFLGWCDSAQKIPLMRAADLLVVPSVWPEPFGMVGPEAGCVGLPAVAFATGGILDWLTEGETGELAPSLPYSKDGLAHAIARALADAPHHQRLRVGAWNMAKRFQPEGHLDELETSFRRAIDERAR